MYRIVKKIYQKDLIFFDIYCCVNVHFFPIHVFNLFMFGKKLQLFKKCFVLSFVCELFQTMRNLERMTRQKFYNIFCTKFSLKSHLMKTSNTRRLKMQVDDVNRIFMSFGIDQDVVRRVIISPYKRYSNVTIFLIQKQVGVLHILYPSETLGK